MDVIRLIEAGQLKKDRDGFGPGDTVRVHVKVIEGEKERTQVFEGIVIRRRGDSVRASFTVRRISYGVGVERTFPFYSPLLDKVEVTRWGRVRRAKLYYLRERIGKAARIKASSRARQLSAAQAAAFAATAAAAKAESELVLGEEEPVEDIEAASEELATAEVAPEIAEEAEAPAEATAEPEASAEVEAPEAAAEEPATEEEEEAEKA